MVKSSRFRFFSLAAWNWRLYRRGAAVLLGAATLLEAGLLFGCAGNLNFAATSYDALLSTSGAGVVFAIVLGATLVVAQAPLLVASSGKTRAAYTILTFRLPRWQILAGQTLATAFGMLLALAWQAAVWLGLFWPVAAVQDAVAGRYFGFTVPAAGRLWWAFATSPWFALVLPRTPEGCGLWAGCLAAVSLLAAAVGVHRGWRRLLAFCMAAVGSGCCVLVAGVQFGSEGFGPLFWVRAGAPLTVLAVLAVLAVPGALLALHRAEMAK